MSRYPKQYDERAAVSPTPRRFGLSGRRLAQIPTGSSVFLPLSIQDNSVTSPRLGNERCLLKYFQFTVRWFSELQPQILGGACSTYGWKEMCVAILMGKTNRERQLGRHRNRWKDSIKMDLKYVERNVDLIDLARNGEKWPAVVNTVMKVQFP
jgi:hypothetical protein